MGKAKSPPADGPVYRTVMRDLIGERWGAVWKAVPAAVAGDDIEGVHDVRVASRRLRAAMDVAVGCFPDSWYGPLHDEAKRITSALGDVRDRDVLLDALSKKREAAPPGERPGIERLMTRVEQERDTARAAMLAYLSELHERDVVVETARRFGKAAGAPGQADGGDGR